MLSLPARTNVYLCVRPVDLRKSFDGLSAMVEVVFQRNIFDGHLFLFINKRRDRIKALWWEEGGLVIWYKRLERGSFELPRDACVIVAGREGRFRATRRPCVASRCLLAARARNTLVVFRTISARAMR